MRWLAILLATQYPLGALLLRRPMARSRRALAAALVVVVPIAGPLLALLVRSVRGVGAPAELELWQPEPQHLSALEAHRLGELPPVLERLLSSDAAERLAGLVSLSSSADAAAVSLLRWTVDHGPSEVVLDAALTLEELELRRERQLAAAQEALEAAPSFEHALAAAEAAASGIVSGIADAASVPALATLARQSYHQALALAPERWLELEPQLARLELATHHPEVALALVLAMVARLDGGPTEALRQLQDDAAFAARRFDLMRLTPCYSDA